jgi:hypothetical protein
MHWVYVLKSSKSGNIYVGETIRLFRRWNEHRYGRGGVNTSNDEYDTLIGVYKVSGNNSFMKYYDDMMNGKYDYKCCTYWGCDEDKQSACLLENRITERLAVITPNSQYKVRGGKYCKQTYNFFSKPIEDRPLCNCGLPCEVKLKIDKTKIYFVCPIPTDWCDDFNTGLNVPRGCNFWKEFEPYRKLREVSNRNYARQKFLEHCLEETEDDF